MLRAGACLSADVTSGAGRTTELTTHGQLVEENVRQNKRGRSVHLGELRGQQRPYNRGVN